MEMAGEQMAGMILEERTEQARRIVTDALHRCKHAGVEARGDVSTDTASHALLDAADGALVLVVGSEGHSAVGGAMWGSVSRHVTLHSAVPVVVVREPADPQARKVVVGVDGTPIGEEALGFALDIASRRGWDVEVLHAADAPGSWKSWTENVTQQQAEREAAVARLLSELTAGWHERYPDVAVESSVARLAPGDALRDASANAALLVVGAHGRTGMSRFLGSVSQAAVRHARCPVAVLR